MSEASDHFTTITPGLRPLERWYVFSVLAGSIFHLLRDLLQEIGIQTWISTIVVRSRPYPTSIIWHPYNTVMIEIFLIIASLIILRRSRFGRLGKVTVFVLFSTVIGFLYFWFWL